MKNDFENDLAFGNSAREFWNIAYKKAFPVMLKAIDYSKNMKAQAVGVDTVISLPFKGALRIDEKMRRHNYGDVLIEYISNDIKNTPGWIEKDLHIDFIGYAYMDSREVMLIPFIDLQNLWKNNKISWIKKYKLPPAKNEFYNTLNVAVPLSEIQTIRIIKVKVPLREIKKP